MEKQKVKTKQFSYKEQHAVIVRVDTEDEQKKVFKELQKLGFKNLKVVSV